MTSKLIVFPSLPRTKTVKTQIDSGIYRKDLMEKGMQIPTLRLTQVTGDFSSWEDLGFSLFSGLTSISIQEITQTGT
jgi:hypothetical protein